LKALVAKVSLSMVVIVACAVGYFVYAGNVPLASDASEISLSQADAKPVSMTLDPFVDESDELQMSPIDANGYLARIMLDSPGEVEQALRRAEKLYNDGAVQEGDNPLAFVLHGPEVEIFFKDNYQQYKTIVDLAAKLSAFNVVDVKVCRARLSALGGDDSVLPAFVDTVPFGPAEVDRLVDEEEYVYF